MRIGYARVSTQDQKLELQLDALKKAECEMIFKEKASGKNLDRPELEKLFAKLRAGDTLVVWKLDRLGRSIKDLIELITKLHEMEVTFVSLQDGIDTKTTTGRFTFNLFACLAEFERELIRERTNAGLTAARARGRQGGRPGGITKAIVDRAITIKILYKTGKKTMQEIADQMHISRATAYRYLDLLKDDEKAAELIDKVNKASA